MQLVLNLRRPDAVVDEVTAIPGGDAHGCAVFVRACTVRLAVDLDALVSIGALRAM